MSLWRCIIFQLISWPLLSQSLLIGTHYKQVDQQGLYSYNINQEVSSVSRLVDLPGTSIVISRKWSSLVYTCGIQEKGKAGLIHCYDLKSGKVLKSIASGDSRPCYLSLSKDQNYLFVANIRDGSVCSFKLDSEGVPLGLISKVQVEPVGKRFAPHACEISPDGDYLFVPDIAGNRLCRMKINNKTGELKYIDSLTANEFTGPRHLTFDKEGERAYMVNQMGEAISILYYKSGELSFVENVQSLPNDKLDINNHIAEIKIHPSGKFVYASNRGHDSIALFKRDLNSGMLEFVKCFSSGGEAPWSFAISANGEHLFCTNNKSNNLVFFTIDQSNGHIKALDRKISVPNPACVIYTAQ